jgi:hypothetical protein
MTLTKQPLFMPTAMERCITFAATIVGKSFLPRLSVLRQRTNLDAAVNANTVNEVMNIAATSQATVRIIPMEKK